MNRDEIRNNALVLDLIEIRDLTPEAADNVYSALLNYCKVQDMTPEQLIDEAIEDEEAGRRMPQRRIKRRFINFRTFLKENEYSSRYAIQLMTNVRGFYRENDIQLPDITMSSFKVYRKKPDDIPKKDDIKRALAHANKKYKAIILLMASSGMGSSEVRSLRYRQFFELINDKIDVVVKDPLDIPQIVKLVDDKDIILQWTVIRTKINFEYYTCSTPETTRAILEYLETDKPNNMDDYLFRTKGEQIKKKTLIRYFQILSDKCGFPKIGPTRYFRAHALRSYFATTLNAHDIREQHIEFMLGHTSDRTKAAYNLPTKDGILRQYLKVVDVLGIEKVKVAKVSDEEFVRMRNDIEELKKALSQEKIAHKATKFRNKKMGRSLWKTRNLPNND